jgi:DNA-binding response OmpR family regulator
MSKCPCCGQPIASNDILVDLGSGRVTFNGKVGYLTLKESMLVNCMVEAFPTTVSKDRLIMETYGQDEPESVENCIRVLVIKARKVLEPLGLRIESDYMRGYRLAKIELKAA